MNNLRVIRFAFFQQLKMAAANLTSFALIANNIPTAAMLAWIANSGSDARVLAHVAVGVFMMAVWNYTLFNVGWSLSGELFSGTLELSLISRTPLVVVMFGKSIAVAAYGMVAGLAGLIGYFAVAQEVPEVASLPLLILSIGIALLALITTTFMFAPFTVLYGGRAGFFNGIQPLGVALSGFLYPVSLLPTGLEIIGRLLPLSWGTDAILVSIRNGDLSRIVSDWALALLLTAGAFMVALLMFRAVERRLRVTGALGTF